jgi:MFS family permease
MSGLSLALGPILGGALVDGFGWRSIFWINVPIVAATMVCTALFVPESRAARARRFDPVGQTLVILVLGSVVYAIIESRWLGWTSPIILSLLGVGIGVLGLLSTGRWALDTARRAATLFEEVDRGADLRTAPSARTT